MAKKAAKLMEKTLVVTAKVDLADLLAEQDLAGQTAVDDLLADLRNALETEGVGDTRPAEGRLLLLIAVEQRLVAPLGGEAGVGQIEFNLLNTAQPKGAYHRV
jgi:hypothetical protein